MCTPNAKDAKVRRAQPSENFLKPKPESANVNETSILTVVNESERSCDVVFTGDSTTREILPLVKGKEIGIFQVPHHGSSVNSKLEECCGGIVKEEYSKIYDVIMSSMQDKVVKETALFYITFSAQCYLISAGGTDNHNHPNSQVLRGIIFTNAFRRRMCVILLTNSCGLLLQKLRPLHQISKAQNWSKYVKIYHHNDVFDIIDSEQCHICIRPDHEKCISDVRTNALEWTPEGYINKIRTIISQTRPTLNDSRPLPQDRFITKSTVEVAIEGKPKFTARYLCSPSTQSQIRGKN